MYIYMLQEQLQEEWGNRNVSSSLFILHYLTEHILQVSEHAPNRVVLNLSANLSQSSTITHNDIDLPWESSVDLPSLLQLPRSSDPYYVWGDVSSSRRL